MGDSPTNPPKSGQLTKHLYLTPQESPPHSQVRAGGRKTNKLFSLSQHRHASQARDTTQVNIVQHVRAAYLLPRQAPTHTNLASLLTCLVTPFILNSTTSHVRRLLITLTLVACWCVGTRVCHCTPNSLFQDSALTAGSTRKVKDAGERWGTPPPIPPTNLAPAGRIAAVGDPPRTPITVPHGPKRGHPAKPARSFKRATAHHKGNPSQAPSRRPTGDTPRAN